MSFLDKYQPQSISDLFGNKILITKAIQWITNFNQEDKKVLLLIGSPGIGKTSLAHLLLKEHNYDPIELNTSNCKGSKVFAHKILKIINNTNIVQLFNNNSKLSIVLDDIDSFDRGIVKQLIQIIQTTQYKEKKKNKIQVIYSYHMYL